MVSSRCLRCRLALLRTQIHHHPIPGHLQSRPYSAKPPLDIESLLSKPTWSVRSLVPPTSSSGNSQDTDEISPTRLRHLLRLSALPPPKDAAEESRMLDDLHSQLHFVRDVQSVDASGVEPLAALRDETKETRRRNTIGLASMKDVLAQEEVVGRTRRPRRRRDAVVENKTPEWDPLKLASRTVGRYFVVESTGSDEGAAKEDEGAAKEGEGETGIGLFMT